MRINVTIKGKTPLVMNKFDPKFDPNVKYTKSEKIESLAYRKKNGELMIPLGNLLQRIHEAVRPKIRLGLKYVAAYSSILEDELGLSTKDYDIYHKSVTLPTGEKKIVNRPMLNKWQTSFTIINEPLFLSDKFLFDLIEDIGNNHGLLVSKKSTFGRFDIINWDVLEK
jgi:hypothetical protein